MLISTPGFDNAPYLTAPCWVSKDPETGTRNMGTYRAMVKSRTRLGICCGAPQHLGIHWDKCKAKGNPCRPPSCWEAHHILA
ncbi:MAG: UbiD family decarboxylase [Chloroflexi bacterium]|nr:UbiD family decarboxylase [Chloroflexota bacterium]